MRLSRSVVLRALVSAATLAVLLLVLPWAELREAFGAVDLRHWAAAVAIFLAAHGLGVLKWRLLINAGRGNLGLRSAAGFYASGLFANLCLPSIVGGDVLRAVLASRETGRKVPVIFGGIADRLIDVLALLLLILAGSVRVWGHLPPEWTEWTLVVLAAGVAVGLAAGLLGWIALRRRKLAAWSPKIRRTVGRTLVALRRLSERPGAAVLALLIALTIQTAFVLLNAWIGRLIGIDAPVAAWFVVWPLAKVVATLPVSLGGLGVRDATLAGLLTPFGVPMARGVVAGLVWQTVLVGGGLLAGGLWLALSDRGAAAFSSIREVTGKVASESGR